jgi:uncharacterized membrane protein
VRRKLLVLGVLITVLLTVGTLYAIQRTDDVSALTPQQLVETYYRSIAAGDLETARSCLSPGLLSIMNQAVDSDFINLVSLSNLRVSSAAHIKLDSKNFDEVQVAAEYDAVHKKILTSNDGHQIRFIYVGKSTRDAPWKIISIGTGP